MRAIQPLTSTKIQNDVGTGTASASVAGRQSEKATAIGRAGIGKVAAKRTEAGNMTETETGNGTEDETEIESEIESGTGSASASRSVSAGGAAIAPGRENEKGAVGAGIGRRLGNACDASPTGHCAAKATAH